MGESLACGRALLQQMDGSDKKLYVICIAGALLGLTRDCVPGTLHGILIDRPRSGVACRRCRIPLLHGAKGRKLVPLAGGIMIYKSFVNGHTCDARWYCND